MAEQGQELGLGTFCLDARVETRDQAVCMHCGAIIIYQNTSNMAKHLESVHKLKDVSHYLKERAYGVGAQATLAFTDASMSAAKKRQLDVLITKFLAEDGRAVNLITGHGFQSFIKVHPLLSLFSLLLLLHLLTLLPLAPTNYCRLFLSFFDINRPSIQPTSFQIKKLSRIT